MIYDELRYFLVKAASPEEAELYDAVVDVLDKYEVPDYLLLWETTIAQFSGAGEQAVIDGLRAVTHTQLEALVQSCGISVNEELALAQLTQLADALFELPYYEARATVLDILDSGESEAEKLATLLHLLIPCGVDNLLTWFDSVSESYCSSLREQVARLEAAPSQAVDVDQVVAAYRVYKDRIENAPLWADAFLDQASTLKLSLSYYVNAYLKANAGVLHRLPVDEVARELCALALLSHDGAQAPLVSLKPYFEQVYPEMNQATQLQVALTKLTVSLSRG